MAIPSLLGLEIAIEMAGDLADAGQEETCVNDG